MSDSKHISSATVNESALILVTYLPFLFGFVSSVCNTVLQESRARRNESDVASMMITSGVGPHALHEKPKERSISSKLR